MSPYFYLVKITQKCFAESMIGGQIYMQPLSAFGDLSSRTSESANAFRGDVLEGTATSGMSSFFDEAFEKEVKRPVGIGRIAECFLQERIFSLYCLEATEDLSEFRKPDERLLDFGDTAVIILDAGQFLLRVAHELKRRFWGMYWVGTDRVRYAVDLTNSGEYDEFTKRASYSWQNEYRLAVDLSNGLADLAAWDAMTDACKHMFLEQGGSVALHAGRVPLVLEIGDLNDICFSIPTTDFINLNLPFAVMNHIYVPPPHLPPRQPVVTTYRPVIEW